MSTNTQTISMGDAYDSNIEIHQQINEASHLPDELKTQLEEMNRAVTRMKAALPAAEAERAARDLKTLTDEATSPAPRREWWQLSIDGLVKAAKNVGEVGKSVIETAATLIPLLAAISGKS